MPDATAAADATGLDVPRVTALPRASPASRSTRSSARSPPPSPSRPRRAARAAADAGTTLPAPAARSRRQPRSGSSPVPAPPRSGPAPRDAVPRRRPRGRAVRLLHGVAFDVARDYLLSLPGLPDDVVAQLRTFAADGSTLPLPVPTDRVTTSPAEVDGVPATLLETRDRTMAAVVWVEDGVVTVVAGALDADEVLAVARDVA